MLRAGITLLAAIVTAVELFVRAIEPARAFSSFLQWRLAQGEGAVGHAVDHTATGVGCRRAFLVQLRQVIHWQHHGTDREQEQLSQYYCWSSIERERHAGWLMVGF